MRISGSRKRKLRGIREWQEKRQHHSSWLRRHPETKWDYMDHPPAVCSEVPAVIAVAGTTAPTLPATERHYGIRRGFHRAAIRLSIRLNRIWNGIIKRGLSA
ncbi:MAG: hypothetical protein V1809_08860 [Planctomycetota bacterium]